jgi:hypothetical protein
MKPLIAPMPNLNGNTGTSLINPLSDVRHALEETLQAFAKASDCIHGRNFQTLPDGEAVRREAADAWYERMRALDAMKDEILAMQLTIQERDNR